MRNLVQFLVLSIFSWSQALGCPLAASGVLALGIYYSGLSSRMSAVWWVAAAPLLYLCWLLLVLAISALEMQLLFRNYEKPRHVLIHDQGPDPARHARLLICYIRAYMFRNLPLYSTVVCFPVIGRLSYLAYAPSCKIGVDVFNAGFMYDPDLTELGDYVVIGGNCVLAAHSMTAKESGGVSYVSAKIRVGNRVTLGGESRIALGVTIGDHSIVEPFSNVTAMTFIPPGEVWGGNPAVFLRKRTDLQAPSPTKALAPTSVLAANLDSAVAAVRVVRQALNLSPPEAATETDLETLRGPWDSLAQLAIAATLADSYGCHLKPAEIAGLESLADVERAILAAKQPSANLKADDDLVLPRDPEWLPLLRSDEATRLLAQSPSGSPTAVPDEAKSTNVQTIKIVIAASFTAEPVASSLSLWSRAFGITADIEFCGYNQIIQALLTPESAFRGNATGLNVVLLRAEDFLGDHAAATTKMQSLLDAIQQFARQSASGSTLIVGTLPPLLSPTAPSTRLQIDALRMRWAQELAGIEGVQSLDFAGVIERVGRVAASDVELEMATRAPFSAVAYRELGIELARIVRCRCRTRAKVLALDCDNTLWGGIIGEEGLDGLSLGDDGPGRSFQAFQRALLELKQSGVLLTLVSRNEERDVFAVFDRHPGMILKRSDIAAWRINWQPKSQNLQQLAAEMNLGLDAFVFVDDDPAQRLHVETSLPAVHVFPLPAEPALATAALRSVWIFDTERLTIEDSARTAMMQQERARQQHLVTGESGNLDAYLSSLDLQVELREVDDADLARVAQLTQKTNQFNLSLNRRSLEAIKTLGGDHRTFVLSARDRFGDYGQIGVCILRHEDSPATALEIDSFLISCRALGRGVEDAFLYGVFEIARRIEVTSLRAPYVLGPRNQPARDFFTRCGFSDSGNGMFEIDLPRDYSLPPHATFRLHMHDTTTI